MKLLTVEEKLTQIRVLTLFVSAENRQAILSEIPQNFCTDFDELIGKSVQRGAILQCDGKKYMVMQDTMLTVQNRPLVSGASDIFRLHQGEGMHPWVSGEYCEVGYLRMLEDVIYEAVQDPGANVHSPELNTKVWRQAGNISIPNTEGV